MIFLGAGFRVAIAADPAVGVGIISGADIGLQYSGRPVDNNPRNRGIKKYSKSRFSIYLLGEHGLEIR